MRSWIDDEDVNRFDHEGKTYARYHVGGKVYASDGPVMEHLIECPKHNGHFDIRAGRPLGAPVCVALKTYPAKIEAGRVMVQLG